MMKKRFPLRAHPRRSYWPTRVMLGRRVMTFSLAVFAVLLATAAQAAPATAASASMPAATPACPADRALRASDLYGPWSVELPALGVRGRLTLKQHPEFSDSLRGLFDYAGPTGGPPGHVQSIASGDIEAGDFNLDESRDGKSLYAFWTGHVQPGACGREIRGQWETVVKDNASVRLNGASGSRGSADSGGKPLKSPFILRRIGP